MSQLVGSTSAVSKAAPSPAPPPTQQSQQQQRLASKLHHRRPPPHASVSLRHSTSSSSSSPTKQVKFAPPAGNPSSEHSSLINNKHSSGQSSNAEKWFDQSNNNVHAGKATFVDNDPPFYHRDSSNESPPHALYRKSSFSANSGPHKPVVFQTNDFSSGSSSEEYRSVIDDLTIENKKLKARLKKLEGSKNSPLASDRLFEVKVYGLAPSKKRELDTLLTTFAMGLHQAPTAIPTMSGAIESTLPALPVYNSGNSLVSKFADSGYGSAGPSGQTPTARSGSSSTSQARSQPTAPQSMAQVNQTTKSRDQNIRSYLHDIPEGLLPKHSTAMTEKTKKKLVVRRLEQIFAGRGAANEGHQLPIQQQEVSHSAARADRSAVEALGHRVKKEGIREAYIMDLDSEERLESHKPSDATPPKDESTSAETTDEQSAQTVEQRPTRPLDLDPHRAQIPAENIQYFRHLGFLTRDSREKAEEDKEDWIYLNLLINMAQLHTINVTPEFVKKAVSEFSSKLELSEDGRKVRWKGGRRVTQDSSVSSGAELSPENSVESQDGTQQPMRKRARLSQNDAGDSLANASHRTSHNNSPKNQLNDDRFAYTPIFHHEKEEDESEDESASEAESLVSSIQIDETTGHSSTNHKSSSPRSKREDGVMVFYNNAKFCTDLSGDSRRSPRSVVNSSDYVPFVASAVGVPAKTMPLRRMFASAKASPLYREKVAAMASEDVMDVDSEDGISVTGLSLSSSNSVKRVQFAEPQNVEFEVSGLGGVRPADNLAITVLRQQRFGPIKPSRSPPHVSRRSRLSNVLPRRSATPVDGTTEKIVSTRSQALEPSTLPPPSYVMSDGGDSGSDSDDSDVSMAAYNGSNPTFSTATHAMDLISPSSSVKSLSVHASDANEADDDGSVDLLATARQLDPALVHAKEREYDSNVAERLAEEIPAGSSAATAGGGSGFNSPFSDGEGDEEKDGSVSNTSVKDDDGGSVSS